MGCDSLNAPPAQQHFARLHGIQMHFASCGAGQPVVLLHGFPDTHRSWDLQLRALVDAGRQPITPDLRGYGSTDRTRSGYDLDTLSEDIAALIDHVGAPVSLVGHDWGGAVAWRVAARFPEKLSRLIVLNCPHPMRMMQELVRNGQQRRRSWYMLFFQLPVLPEWWLTRNDAAVVARIFRSQFGDREPPRQVVEAARRALVEPDAARAAIAYYRTAARALLHPLRTREEMRSWGVIDTPTTVIWGEHDVALGTELLDGTDRLVRHLTVHRVANAGHFVHQERPDEVNALLVRALGGSAA